MEKDYEMVVDGLYVGWKMRGEWYASSLSHFPAFHTFLNCRQIPTLAKVKCMRFSLEYRPF
jgi:hypothetical protein